MQPTKLISEYILNSKKKINNTKSQVVVWEKFENEIE